MIVKPITPEGARGFKGKGRNIMTPLVLAYFSGKVNGQIAHIEVAQERGARWSQTVQHIEDGGVLVGISFRKPNGEHLEPDPSCCLCDVRGNPLEAALARLKEM